MSLVLVGSTSGSITLQEPAVAGTTTINLPASSGTVVVGSSAVSATGQIPFSTDGSTYTPTAKIVSGTAVASTSGTSILFTGIPSWTKRITIMFSGVENTGTGSGNTPILRIGNGSVETSGYLSNMCTLQASPLFQSETTGFLLSNNSSWASTPLNGTVVLTLLTGFTWCLSGSYTREISSNTMYVAAGTKTTSAAIDRLSLTTQTGTATWNAGTINILYE
jgi:hypothetical protein